MKKLSLFMLLMLTLSSTMHNAQARVPMSGALEFILFCTFPPYTLYVLGCALEDGIKETSNGIKNLHPHTKLAVTLSATAGVAGAMLHPENPAEGALVGAAAIGILSAAMRLAEIGYDDYNHIDNQILRAISAKDTAQTQSLLMEKATKPDDKDTNHFAYHTFYNAAFMLDDKTIQAEMLALIKASNTEYELVRHKSHILKRDWPHNMVDSINNATTITQINELVNAYETAQRLLHYKAQAVKSYSESPYSWPREVIEKIEQATSVNELDYIITHWWL